MWVYLPKVPWCCLILKVQHESAWNSRWMGGWAVCRWQVLWSRRTCMSSAVWLQQQQRAWLAVHSFTGWHSPHSVQPEGLKACTYITVETVCILLPKSPFLKRHTLPNYHIEQYKKPNITHVPLLCRCWVHYIKLCKNWCQLIFIGFKLIISVDILCSR